MPLFLSFTKKLYISLSILIRNLNKIIVCQKYYLVEKRKNKKEKNSDLRKICLKCSRKGCYKEEGNYI